MIRMPRVCVVVLLAASACCLGQVDRRLIPLPADDSPVRRPQSRDAGTALVTAPILGFAPGAHARELQTLSGIPGASTFGPALMLPEAVKQVYTAPGQRSALIMQEGSPGLSVFRLDSQSAVPIVGSLESCDAAWFSPTGAAVAVRSGARVQIIRGLPAAAAAGAQIAVNGSWIAPSDDGRLLLSASPDGVVHLAHDGSPPVPLLFETDAAAATFLPLSHDAVIADRRNGSLILMSDLDRNGTTLVVASGLEIGAGEVFLRPSADGRSVFLTWAGSQRLLWIAIDPEVAPRAIDLPVAASRLDAMRSLDTFLFSAEPGQPAWLLVRAADGVRSVFVGAGSVGHQEEPSN